MREGLKNFEGKRKRFRAYFVRFGTKKGYKGLERTILLKYVEDVSTNRLVAEHLWFNLTKGFAALDLKEGDQVEFDARVKRYVKGYKGYREDVWKPLELDYKLSHPTKLRKLTYSHS